MAIGMLLTLMCSIPASAETAEYPYPYNDFNAETDIPTASGSYPGNMKVGGLDGTGATVAHDATAGKCGTGAAYVQDDAISADNKNNGSFRFYVRNTKDILASSTGFKLSFSMKVSEETVVSTTTGNTITFVFYSSKTPSRSTATFNIEVDNLKGKLASGDWVDITLDVPTWTPTWGYGESAKTLDFIYVRIPSTSGGNHFVDVGNACNFWVDDFRMEPNASADAAKPSASVTASLTNVAEGHEVSLGYTFSGGTESLTEGNSIVRVLRETAVASGKFTPIAEYFKADYPDSDAKFLIPDGYEGLKIKVEVLPVAADGTVGEYAYATSAAIGKGTEIAIVDINTSAFASTKTVTADYSVLNHKQDGTAINGVLVAIMYDGYEIVDYDFIDFACALKADNTAVEDTITLTAGSGELTPDATAISGIDSVKFFLWERDPSLDASAESKIFTVTMTELAGMEECSLAN